MHSDIFKLCFHEIFCYNKASSADSGWIVAGWTKMSMGIALSEKPMLAGRLRRLDDGGLEIVLNDSGIRLVEPQIAISMEEFVSAKATCLLGEYWLFPIEITVGIALNKVTNFKCGAYSIEISCSLLIADPLSVASFLKRWTEIHINLVNESQTPKLPLSYLPNSGKSSSTFLCTPTRVTSKKNKGQTMIFKYANMNSTMDSEMKRSVVVSCIQKAMARLGNKATPNFSLLAKESSNVITKIDAIYVKQVRQMGLSKNLDAICGINTSWSDYIDVVIIFAEGNKPIDILCSIYSPADEGLAIIISSHLDMTVIVTVPNETK
ncbi:putative anthranilate N-benzoyltransferase protein 3 [Heracleum sosnowskyi]|uniref:Anthranilate N-benzoyltransferase protein 3 n=1 Tax=Heracleum sosnowskyi TaxID=360622 RepID=A0AAD8HT12_9APIA|nr:putative anthranilate N-benzoyltransferase protein 3 [Heracleum sosnowskyi]